MPERDTQVSGKIKHTGIFDFKNLYSFVYDWLSTEEYGVYEKQYKEKVSGDSKEVEIDWEAKKKVSDYFMFMIKLNWRIIGLKKVKVKKGDKEVTMDSGDLEIKFSGILVKDYEARWEEKPLYKFLRGVYERYVIRARINEYEDKVAEETNQLVDQIKAFLALEVKS